MINLGHRSEAREIIDHPEQNSALLRQTYQQIKSINRYTWGYWPTMSAIKYLLARCGRRRVIKILDVGCGDGETLRRIDAYGRRHQFSLELTGIDLSLEPILAARALTQSKINYIHGDIFAGDDKTYDIIINSLTTHHMTNEEIVKLMQWMKAHARVGWSIADLNRRAIAYHFIKNFVKLAGYNHVICHDAPLSVARSFRRQDWVDLLTQAQFNLDAVKISWYPNFRYGIRYEKPL
jgi:2-polyprenyl-3-methyl-5-hydroxy-6-metoxy-1,4-benzoquinol methylase